MKNGSLVFGMLASLTFAWAADVSPLSTGSDAVAEVDGSKLTLSGLEQQNPTVLFQARNAFYDAEKKAVDSYIDQYLLERQAKKENLTVDELLKKHVDSTIAKDPSEESLRVYFEGVDTTQSYEAVRPQILEALRARRLAKAKSAYIQSLRKETSIAILLTPPRALVSVKDAPVRGRRDAPVQIVEFADYECPYCQQAQPALDRLISEYKNKVAFSFKDTPLPMHSHAQKASEAGQCANAQGKFWEYHDLLFTSKELEIPQLKEQARKLNLDSTAFDKCLDSGEMAETVKAQLGEAEKLGLQGTPSFFINGRFYSGAMTYEALQAAVEEELSKSAVKENITAKR